MTDVMTDKALLILKGRALYHASLTTGGVEMSVYPNEIFALLARLEAAEAIVKRLPKTADGVPITPGAQVWCCFDEGVSEIEVVDVSKDQCQCEINEGEFSGWFDVRDADKCYSTREAALASTRTAAAGKEPPHA